MSAPGTPDEARSQYQWAAAGDINAFFGLMLDNVVNLAVLAGILVGGFGFPATLVYTRMFPGTALGVLFGDVVYTVMAIRLARRTGRTDVTAMPLGLDAPSTIGMALTVLGPAFIAAKAQMPRDRRGDLAWQVGMAVMVLMGVFKLIMSFIGDRVRRAIPEAGLLGSIGGVGIALLGTLQLGEIYGEPIVGMMALGVILYALVAKIRLPFRAPEVLVERRRSASALYYGLGALGLSVHHVATPVANFPIGFPLPSLGFLKGMPIAVREYIPLALPFAILTVIGGINVTESARIAGDDYNTRDILLTEAIATLIAGVCGGVSQSTPYIGHPAYKAMGGRAGYTLATGLFIGLGGILGYIAFMADVLPKPALAPILVFVALDITEQSYLATPKRHAAAVTLAIFPSVAQLVQIFLITGLQRRADVRGDRSGRHDEGDGPHESGFHQHGGRDGAARARLHSHGDAVGRRGRVPDRPTRSTPPRRRWRRAPCSRSSDSFTRSRRRAASICRGRRVDAAVPLDGRLPRRSRLLMLRARQHARVPREPAVGALATDASDPIDGLAQMHEARQEPELAQTQRSAIATKRRTGVRRRA